MASPKIPSTIEEIDPPHIPYIRAKHPILATAKPSISRAVPPRILERLIMAESNIGMMEGQLVGLLLRQGLINSQGFKARLFTRQSYMFTRQGGSTLGTLVLPTPSGDMIGS